MLVLSRRKDESLMIGDDITIVVVEIRGDKVRLAIQAPNEIPVHRQEVYQAIQREQERDRALAWATSVDPLDTQLQPVDSSRVIEELGKYITVSDAEAEQIRAATLRTFLVVASKIWHSVEGRGTVPVFPMPLATFRASRKNRKRSVEGD
jgi:carbon storage regulator